MAPSGRSRWREPPPVNTGLRLFGPPRPVPRAVPLARASAPSAPLHCTPGAPVLPWDRAPARRASRLQVGTLLTCQGPRQPGPEEATPPPRCIVTAQYRPTVGS